MNSGLRKVWGIAVAAVLTFTSLGYSYSGGSGTMEDPYQITTAEQMNTIGMEPANWSKSFILMADIDMSAYTGTQFNIIGNAALKFTGTFDGSGHVIRNLTYTTTAPTYYVGLFGYAGTGAVIKNLGLDNVHISSAGSVIGGLAGGNIGTITNCYCTGSVTGVTYVGGLAGGNGLGTGVITDSYSICTVSGTGSYVGGLVGQNLSGIIMDCDSTGDINGADSSYVGGLAGYSSDGTVSNCRAAGSVSGGGSVGGLVGHSLSSGITNCYSMVYVNGTGSFVGGLVGYNLNSSVSNCHATGTVTGPSTGQYNGFGGLIGYNSGSNVNNCYATGVTTGSYGVGGLVGYNSSSPVNNCYAAGTVTNSSVSGEHYYFGGLIGYNTDSAVSNCYATGTVTNPSGGQYYYNFGGLIGYHSRNTVSNCYSTGTVSGSYSVGGLFGYNSGGSVNSFWDMQTSGRSNGVGSGSSSGITGKTTAQMQDINTFLSAGWDFVLETANGTRDIWMILPNQYPHLAGLPITVPDVVSMTQAEAENAVSAVSLMAWTTGSYSDTVPAGQVVNQSPAAGTSLFAGMTVNIIVSLGPDNPGSGTEADPYKIGTIDDWQTFVTNSANWNKHFILIANLDLQGITLTPIGNSATKFTGSFNGGGHIIRNAAINAPNSSYVGLFGWVDSAGRISNLGLESSAMTGVSFVGGLVGISYGIVSDCYATGTITGSSDYIGGLIGGNAGTVRNCYTKSTVICNNSNSQYVGGLIGYNLSGIISNCYAESNTTGYNYIGGLIGYNSGGTVGDCYAAGIVIGSENVGGLVGYNTGGIISDCYAAGSVKGGGRGSDITSSNGQSLGGLVGYNAGGTISNCYALGAVIGPSGGQYSSFGGLVGYNAGGTISKCYATGPVTGRYEVGGLVGSHYGTISNCYARGAVTGYAYTGGLTGNIRSRSTISYCYATGAVTGFSGSYYIGGLIGYGYFQGSDSTITACFWDTQTSGISVGIGSGTSSSGMTGKTTAQMQDINTFVSAGWDFIGETANGIEDTWAMNEYPMLDWQSGIGIIGNTSVEVVRKNQGQIVLNIYSIQEELLPWTVTGFESCNWITAISPTTGSSTGPADRTPVTITIDTANLPIGDYTRNLTITTDKGDTVVMIKLTVRDRTDMDDFALLASYWGQTGCMDGQPCAEADWFADETIDLLDLEQLAQYWLEDRILSGYPQSTNENFETGDFTRLDWQQSGDAPWTIASDFKNAGIYAARSGAIADNQTSTMSFTMDTQGCNKISFAYRVSSEADHDFLKFYIDGQLMNQWSGETTAIPEFLFTPGVHTFTWSYAKDSSGAAGSDAAWIDTIEILRYAETIEEGFETGNFTHLNWRQSGNTPWTIVSDIKDTGVYAARSGAIANNQNSSLSVTMNTRGRNKISFACKVSSQANGDFLKFYIDGQLRKQWSGETMAIPAEFLFTPGVHTFTWSYVKDASGAAGTDAVWIDTIKISRYIGTIEEGFETGDFSYLDWRQSGDAPWTIVSDIKNAGIYAVRSSISFENQTSAMSVTMDTFDRNKISFAYIASIVPGTSLTFYIDGQLKKQWISSTSSGVVEFLFTPGIHTFTWLHAKSGSFSEPSSARIDTIKIFRYTGTIEEGFETGDFSMLNWQQSGDAPWTIVSDIKNAGIYAARSGTIADNKISTLSMTLDTCENNKISFACRVSSQPDHDFLKFYIDGQLMNQWSGEAAVFPAEFPLTPGVHTFTWSYAKDSSGAAGEDAAWIDTIAILNSLIIIEDGFETGNFSHLNWQQSGDAPWTIVSDIKNAGIYAARSGTITDNQTSVLSVTMDTQGRNKISFACKASSEPDHDFLKFYIDGQLMNQWSGEVTVAIPTEFFFAPGVHTFTWSYARDSSGSAGADAAWIDTIKIQ